MENIDKVEFLDDVDAIMKELEVQFEDTPMLPVALEHTTNGCTVVASCMCEPG